MLDFNLPAGSYKFDTQLPEMEKEEENVKRDRRNSEDEELQTNPVKKKKKIRSTSTDGDGDEEQPGPSSQLTPKRKSKKIHFCKSPAFHQHDCFPESFICPTLLMYIESFIKISQQVTGNGLF